MSKKTVVFDFDGVIHSYKSGYQGITCIPDEPVEGIEGVLRELHNSGYEIVVVSSRCRVDVGLYAIEDYLIKHQLSQYVDRICKEKPPAIVYIDDRAICFDGNTEGLVDKVKNFKTYMEV